MAAMPLLNAGQVPSREASTATDAGSYVPAELLHEAVTLGNVKEATRLIDSDTDVNELDINDLTPLHIAAEWGHIKIVYLLLSKGANINAQNKTTRNTPLHFAAIWNNIEIARMLLNNGANVNTLNIDDETPLDFAIIFNKEKTAKLLIEHGAKIYKQEYVTGFTNPEIIILLGLIDSLSINE